MAVVNRWSAASCSIRAFWAEGRWRRLPQWRSSRWRVQPASADGEGLERVLDAAVAGSFWEYQQPVMGVVGQWVWPGLEVQLVYLVHRDADGSYGQRVSAVVPFVGVLGRVLGPG